MRNKYKGEDIRARLGGTILRYKGHPYYCEADGTSLQIYSMEGGGLAARVDADDPFLDISSITLGFMNVDGEYKCTVYLKREGARQFKQGVSLAHLTQKVLRRGVSILNHRHLQSKGLVDCVLGRYPTFTQAVDMITNKGWHSVALSRNVALQRDEDLLKVHVKLEEVGYVRLGTKRVILPKTEYSFVTRSFLDEINGWEISEGNK